MLWREQFVNAIHVDGQLFATDRKPSRIARSTTAQEILQALLQRLRSFITNFGVSHMNAKVTLSALVLALALVACAKKEEAAAPAAAEPAAAAAPAAETAAPADAAAPAAAPAEAPK